MLDENSIEAIVSEVAEFAEHKSKGKDYPLSSIYDTTVELYEQVKVHSQLNTFPERLISANAPNETDAEFEYKRSTYQPITRPIWKEATTQVNRIFNKQNYSITGWGNDSGIYENVAAKDYFDEDYPQWDNYMSFIETLVKPAKDEDPNGVLALDLKYTEFPDTELPEPYLKNLS